MASIRLSTSISLMFREHPIVERFGVARAAGFGGVEIQVLGEGTPAAMAHAAQAARVEVVLINVDTGDLRAGGPGFTGVPGRTAEFRAALAEALEAASILGARYLHLGPSRIPEGQTRAACLDTYRGNLEMAASMARGHSVELLIEPINRIDVPTVLLSDFGEARTLIGECGSGAIGLLFDIYHAAMSGLDVRTAVAECLPIIRHVQFSDAPGRHEPGTGQVPFESIFADVASSSYSGWMGAEYLPTTTTAASLGWLSTIGARFRR